MVFGCLVVSLIAESISFSILNLLQACRIPVGFLCLFFRPLLLASKTFPHVIYSASLVAAFLSFSSFLKFYYVIYSNREKS